MLTVLGMDQEAVMEMGEVAAAEEGEDEDEAEGDEMVLEVLLGGLEVLEVLVVRDGQGLNQTACGMVQEPVKDKRDGERRVGKVREGRERHWRRPPWQ